MSFFKRIAVPAYLAALCMILGATSASLKGYSFGVALFVGAVYAGGGLTGFLVIWGLVKVADWSQK